MSFDCNLQWWVNCYRQYKTQFWTHGKGIKGRRWWPFLFLSFSLSLFLSFVLFIKKIKKFLETSKPKRCSALKIFNFVDLRYNVFLWILINYFNKNRLGLTTLFSGLSCIVLDNQFSVLDQWFCYQVFSWEDLASNWRLLTLERTWNSCSVTTRTFLLALDEDFHFLITNFSFNYNFFVILKIFWIFLFILVSAFPSKDSIETAERACGRCRCQVTDSCQGKCYYICRRGEIRLWLDISVFVSAQRIN